MRDVSVEFGALVDNVDVNSGADAANGAGGLRTSCGVQSVADEGAANSASGLMVSSVVPSLAEAAAATAAEAVWRRRRRMRGRV